MGQLVTRYAKVLKNAGAVIRPMEFPKGRDKKNKE
jgi:hypothetical protein